MALKYKIALRQDGWFDAGRNADHHSIKSVYNDLQAMKRSIERLGPKKTISGLERALRAVTSVPCGFGGKPYFHNMKIFIPSSTSEYSCPIGRVIKVQKAE